MRKSTMFSIIALLVAFVGLLVAFIAYFKRRSCILCDDLDDDLVEYYEGQPCDCGCGHAEIPLEDIEPEELAEPQEKGKKR